MNKKILFDLDGTLTDSGIGITKSVRYALEKFDITVESLDELMRFVGPPLIDSFIKYYNFSKDEAEIAVTYFREYFTDQGIYENRLYEGIDNLLRTLKKEGYTLAIATSKPTVYAVQIVKRFLIHDYFDCIVGSHLDGTRTNKGEIVKIVLEEMKITDYDQVVMVGDRKHDIIGGQQNNLKTIGVTYGYGGLEELTQIKATYIVDTVEELKHCLFSI